MDATTYIKKVRSAGFELRADGDRLLVSPVDQLSDTQRQFLRDHKADILTALRSEGAILDAGQSGNDIEVANDPGRVTIHVPELRLASGQRVSCDMTVPVKNLNRLRAVLKFTLKDGQGGGSLLGSPGTTEGELREILREKYSERLESINGAAP